MGETDHHPVLPPRASALPCRPSACPVRRSSRRFWTFAYGLLQGDAERGLAEAAASLGFLYPVSVERRPPDPSLPTAFSLRYGLNAGSLRLRSADGHRTVQLRLERLTVSLLFQPTARPYDCWETLEDSAFTAWDVFERAARPESLVRLATRFVNRIDTAGRNPRDLFTHPPHLPIPGVRLESVDDRQSGVTDDGFGVQVGRSFGPRVSPRPGIVYFDVEAFRPYGDRTYGRLPPEPPIRRDDLAGDLSRLRELKNDLFHRSLSPGTLARYGP